MIRKLFIYQCILIISLTACNVNEITASITPNLSTTSKSRQSESTEVPIITSSPETKKTPGAASASLIPSYKPEAWKVHSIDSIGLASPDPSISVFYVYDIEETDSGVIWLASTYGLIRFDGQSWELIKSDAGITNKAFVEKSPSGEIWFTLSDGVYSIKDEVVQNRMKFMDFGVDVYDVTGFNLSPDGHVWIVLRDSIWVFDGEDWNPLESENELPFSFVGYLINDHNGLVYTWGKTSKSELGEAASRGSAYGGLSCFDGNLWEYFDQKEQYGIPSADETMFSAYPLITDDQNHVWFYIWREGLFEYHNEEFLLHVPHDIDLYQPESMVFDHNGTLWLGDWGEGVQIFKYVPGSEGFQTIDGSFTLYIIDEVSVWPIFWYEIEDVLPFENVTALYVDSNNDLWIATELGVYVYDIDM